MRLFACLIVFFVGSAAADQNDPLLDDFFDQLRSGQGEHTRIESEIRTLWARAPEVSVQVLVDRLITALETEEYAVASVLAEHVTGLAPSYAEGWVLRGYVEQAGETPLRAEIYFRRAVDLEPRHFVALEALGDIANNAGDKDDAFQFYRQALDINPHLAEVREKADQLRFELAGQEI